MTIMSFVCLQHPKPGLRYVCKNQRGALIGSQTWILWCSCDTGFWKKVTPAKLKSVNFDCYLAQIHAFKPHHYVHLTNSWKILAQNPFLGFYIYKTQFIDTLAEIFQMIWRRSGIHIPVNSHRVWGINSIRPELQKAIFFTIFCFEEFWWTSMWDWINHKSPRLELQDFKGQIKTIQEKIWKPLEKNENAASVTNRLVHYSLTRNQCLRSHYCCPQNIDEWMYKTGSPCSRWIILFSILYFSQFQYIVAWANIFKRIFANFCTQTGSPRIV